MTNPAQDQAKEQRERSSEVRDGNVRMDEGGEGREDGEGFPRGVRKKGAEGMKARRSDLEVIIYIYIVIGK